MASSSIDLFFQRKFRYLLIMALAIMASLLLPFLLQMGLRLGTPETPLAGGETTVHNRTSRAFSLPSPGLSAVELVRHLEGDANFDAVFVTAPAIVNPGLGPLFNNPSCNGCHLRDGRGMPQMGQSLVRVSLPEGTPEEPGGAVPVPGIGTQLRDQSIFGHRPDAKVMVTWRSETGHYPDGVAYKLRSPQVKLSQVDPEKPIPANILTSLRVPPAVFGTGLLEAVPEREIIAHADAEDRDRDGISGRPNYVWNPQQRRKVLGRFGLKANTPNLLIQTAAAYHNDIGVTNPLFPDPQGKTDIDQKTLDATAFYVQTLGVPDQTLRQNSQVQHGEKLFNQANCAACHMGTLKTAAADIPVLAGQTFHPYTDLLLHDMGAGLADDRPDFEASGSEWRTAPLWGVGLVQTVLPYSGYLHDGRARTIEEAVLWHGGEAQASKETFMKMKKKDRADLLKFLSSL
jgi:CxxC motif-containing protein (DUF1111 family)